MCLYLQVTLGGGGAAPQQLRSSGTFQEKETESRRMLLLWFGCCPKSCWAWTQQGVKTTSWGSQGQWLILPTEQ